MGKSEKELRKDEKDRIKWVQDKLAGLSSRSEPISDPKLSVSMAPTPVIEEVDVLITLITIGITVVDSEVTKASKDSLDIQS